MRQMRRQRLSVGDADDPAAVLSLLREPEVAEDLQAAQVRVLCGVGHALLMAAAGLRRVRVELAATRLST